MKTKSIITGLFCFALVSFALTGRALDITATNSGNWSDPTIWNSGTVPGANDDADIQAGVTVTVDTNVIVQFIYDSGTVVMGTNESLNVTQDSSISAQTTLITTAPGNTVIFSGNPFFTKQQNYWNLSLENTNYVDAFPPYYAYEDFNNFSSAAGPTPMNIAGDFVVMGTIKVQQGSGGAPITVGGNLYIGSNCIWDCSGDVLDVKSNVFVNGLFEDLNGALGTNIVEGSVIVSGAGTNAWNPALGTGTNGWNVSDVTEWSLGGSLTNNGAIIGRGYGCINFNGTGSIAGSNIITIPTIIVNGTYKIADTILLATNAPTVAGTMIFDLANTNKIILRSYPTNPISYAYSGNLQVISSGPAPVTGTVYQFFSATNYSQSFSSITLPSLPAGLSWVNNLASSGSFAITGNGGSPLLTISVNAGVLTLSWNSTAFPGFSVLAQTNGNGVAIGNVWNPTGSGTVSPYTVTANPANPPVFYRLYHP